MLPKLLACDVDGTLIHHTIQKISDDDIQAIKDFQAQGHFFAFCTGRTLTWTKPLLENIFPDALILCNGSMIYDGNPSYKLIENVAIPNKIALEIMEYGYELGDYVIYWDDGQKTYEISDRLMSNVVMSSVVQENLSIHLPIDDALSLTNDFATLGIAPMSEDVALAEKTNAYISERWGKYISTSRNQFFIDIAPLNSSKGVGITKLINYLQKDFEIYAIGDSLNDLSMFKTVGKDHAFWMKNGDKELMSHTTYHVDSVAECIDIILSQ